MDEARARCLALPALVPVSTEILPAAPGGSKRAYLRALGEHLTLAGAQIALAVTLLAHQAWLMADAVVRTLLRLVVPAGACSSGSPPRR